MRNFGRSLVAAWLATAALAPWLAPYGPTRQFPGHAFAPPTRLQFGDSEGRLALVFRPAVLRNPLERTYVEDASRTVALRWFTDGHLFATAPGDPPFLLLGADGLGRDLFSRLLAGARRSLALAGLAVAVSLAIGAATGLIAGYRGGLLDAVVMRASDFVIVLPALYVLLAVRSVLPVQLPTRTLFALMVVIFGLLGWPVAARGVAAIIARERRREYVLAAEAAGASPLRVMLLHLLPAAAGFLRTQALLLLPAFVVAEAALSFAGLGLPDDAPGWGTLLGETANVGALGGSPWLLAPAVAVATLVLGITLALDASATTPELVAVRQGRTADADAGTLTPQRSRA